ncbi:hypothetical protein D3C72_1214690 [compost metagenome]
MLENRTYGAAADDNNTAATLTRYIYSNHLQSASLELDEDAEIISYEEYHPYGTTSYQAVNASINAVAKRYRYTGKERDEESGLYYHGARYYIPWLCRWTAVDPMEAKFAGMSPYNYAFNNPVMWNDLSGEAPGEENEVVVYGDYMREGEKKTISYSESISGPNGLVMTYFSSTDFYFHRGDEQNKKGWYSEDDYVNMLTTSMVGLVHAAVGDEKRYLFGFGVGNNEALAKADAAALQFLKSNKGFISPDFYSLLQNKSGELASNFSLKNSGTGVVYLSDSPLDIIGPGILKAAGKASISMVEMLGALTKSEISAFNISVFNLTRQAATQLTSEMMEASLTKMTTAIDDIVGKGGYDITSKAVRSALADRVGKRGFTEVGYQFRKHLGRGGNWGDIIPQGASLNPKTFNEAGYKTFQEIWRAPGSFQKVGGFIEKRLPDGRGIRFQDNWQFKGFLD